MKRTRADRTQIQGLYLDGFEYDGDFPDDIGHNPRLRVAGVLSDRFGRQAQVSNSGEMLIGFRADDVSINFQYGISIFDIRDGGVVTGTGTVGTSGAMATVSTGTGVGSAVLESRDAVQYRSGHETYCSPSVVFATPEVNVNQYCGFLNGEDGLALGYQGLTPGLWFIEGGNFNFIPQSAWNIDKLDGTGVSGHTLNLQAGQVPDLKFVWHGFKNLTLELTASDGSPLPAHRIDFINSATTTHLENPSLPVSMKIERTTGTGADLTMYAGSWRAGVIAGRDEDNASNRWFSAESIDFPIAGTANHNVLTVRNQTTFNGKVNHLVAEIAVVDFVNDCNKTLNVRGVYGGTLAGAPAFTDIRAGETPLQYSVGGTVSGGAVGPAAPVRAGDQRTRDVQGTGIKIYPGQDFTFMVPTGGTANGTFTIVTRMKEPH